MVHTMSTLSASEWIEKLKLTRHPEGGWFRETYRSALEILAESTQQAGSRSASTVIYFLLQHKEYSHFHRIASDEHWFFHAGSTLSIHVLKASSPNYICLELGPESPQQWVPAKDWFAAELQSSDPDAFVLVSCVVAPGFDFADFELARADTLSPHYPEHKALIERLCLHF